MESARHVTPGRFRRLTEEMLEERLGVIERSSRPEVLIDEIDYAMRPPRHERRVPSYGSFVLPERHVAEWRAVTGLDVVTSSTANEFDDAVRRYADGMTSWTVRTTNGVDSLVVFDRSTGSERDLVVLGRASGAMIVQRHPNGEVRLSGRSVSLVGTACPGRWSRRSSRGCGSRRAGSTTTTAGCSSTSSNSPSTIWAPRVSAR